ncbi:MAG TPA: zinc-dependent metalloprotease [Candidatus Eisenbacteria bacterium]|nr:zinc-dependent metalloprotease [Candidatus Eisenbacteria bacterium]
MRAGTFGKLCATMGLGSACALLAAAAPAAGQAQRPGPEIISTTGYTARVAPPGAVVARPARTCGTAAGSPAEAVAVQAVLDRWKDEHLTAPGGTIRVAFHVITARGEGEVPDQRLVELIAELNRAFVTSGYRFELARLDRTDEPAWFRMTPGSGRERRAKQELAVDPAHYLNMYTCAAGDGLSGWASLPWSSPEDQTLQGVVLDHASLSGAVHQVGHYLGFVHEAGEVTAASAANLDRVRAIVQVYRPSLFNPAPSPAAGRPEISPQAGAEPEDGRVLSYRGAFPNPFREETALRFTLPTSQTVSLKVYSVTGQLVRTLVDAALPPGDHSAMFRGDGLPSGAYFAVLRAGNVHMSRTLMLVR